MAVRRSVIAAVDFSEISPLVGSTSRALAQGAPCGALLVGSEGLPHP